MPACGREASVFSTLTDRAGRVRLAPPGSERPVSGAVGGATVVVVGAAVVVVSAGFFSLPPAPLQAASRVASTTTTAHAALARRVIPFTPTPALRRPEGDTKRTD